MSQNGQQITSHCRQDGQMKERRTTIYYFRRQLKSREPASNTDTIMWQQSHTANK